MQLKSIYNYVIAVMGVKERIKQCIFLVTYLNIFLHLLHVYSEVLGRMLVILHVATLAFI